MNLPNSQPDTLLQQCISVSYPKADEVKSEFQNDPGTTNKYDESKHIPIKSFTSAAVSEDRRSFFASESKKIYHHMLLNYFDPQMSDYRCHAEFIKRSDEYTKNWTEYPLDQQVFVKYSYSRSVGCGHYIRGCQVKCETCSKFYPCRLCHDDCEDHDFPRYKTKIIKCNYCTAEQPIAQNCRNCQKCFGSYYCAECRLLCGMGENAKPNYHCFGCKMCMVGYSEYSQHCDKCNSCYNRAHFDEHKCIADKGDCIVCMGDLYKTIYGRVTLNCGHQLHTHCYQGLLENGNLKCPVCKRFLPNENDVEWVLKWQSKNYRRIVIPVEYDELVMKVQCNDCQKKFYQHYHPLYYYCPDCKLYNCEAGERLGIGRLFMTILKSQEAKYPDMVRPRHTNLADIKSIVLEFFNPDKLEWDQLQQAIGAVLDDVTLPIFAKAVNRARTLPQLKNFIHNFDRMMDEDHEEGEQEEEQ